MDSICKELLQDIEYKVRELKQIFSNQNNKQNKMIINRIIRNLYRLE